MTYRTRPVFVSGTFRDFHAERDAVASHAFPALVEKLGAYRTHLERVDLRVGVETKNLEDDHAKQALVLKVCLADVRRCRPFLVILMGDRYGWVPPVERARAAVTEEGWRTEFDGKSVTALEIEFGLWGDPEQRTRSRVYFRKLDYAGMTAEDRVVFDDAFAAGLASLSKDDRDRARDRADRLAALKERIKGDPVMKDRWRDYPAVWDGKRVTGLAEFIEMVVADLLPEMRAEAEAELAAVVAGQVPTPLEDFVAERTRGFTGDARKRLVGELVGFAVGADAGAASAASQRGLVLAGPAGSGKSALFARVHEEVSARDDVWLLAHAAGIDPRSTSVEAVIEDFVATLAAKLGVPDPLVEARAARTGTAEERPERVRGADGPKPEEIFAELLSRAATRRRVVVLLDALDRFERTSRAEHLTWLPLALPANVRLIATAIPGTETEALGRRRDFRTELLAPLGQDEAREVAGGIYARYHHAPNEDALKVLLGKRRADGGAAHDNPLWLTGATEELNLFDADDFAHAARDLAGTDEDKLHALVLNTAGGLSPEVPGLYQQIFRRAGKAYGDRLVQAFVATIAAGRAGFRERDLSVLVPAVAAVLDPNAPAVEWDALAFAALRRGLRAHLVRRGADDQWDFHHAQAREAGLRGYLGDGGVRQQVHEAIATHLLRQTPDDPLRETEAMWHLIQADDKERAARLYAGETLGTLTASSETLARHALGDEGLAWVTGLLEVEAPGPDALRALGERFLFNLDRVFDRMYMIAPRAGVAAATLRLFRRLLVPNVDHPGLLRDVSVSLDNVGRVEMARGNLDGAYSAYAEMLKISRGLPDTGRPESLRDVSVSLINVGQVEMARGNLDGAYSAYVESLTISRGLSDPGRPESLRDVSLSLEKVGEVEMARGSLDGAYSAYAEGLKIRRGLSDPGRPESLRDVFVSLDNVGQVEMARGNLDGAYWAYAEGLKVSRGLSDPGRPESLRDVSVCLEKVGQVEMARGNLDGAYSAYMESLKISRGLSDPGRPESLRDVSFSLNYVGEVEMARGSLDGAYSAYAEGLKIRRGLSDPGRPESLRDVSISLENVGEVEMARGSLDGAYSAYAESLKIRRGLSDPGRPESLRDVSISLENVGEVEMARGSLDGAYSAYAESLKIRRGLSDPGRPESLRDVSVSLNYVGQVEMARGNLDGAYSAYGEMLKISRGLSDPGRPESLRDVSVSLNNVGGVEMARGNLDGAYSAYAESLKIRRGLSDPGRPESLRDVSFSLNYVGQVEMARGSLDGAYSAYAESLKIRRGLSDPGRPESLRDVSVSLNYVGQVEMARGNLDGAYSAYGEMLKISRGLSDPGRPESLRDVSVSLNNVGGVEMARGNLDGAYSAYAESLKISRGLSDPGRPESLRDVSVSLNNVGGVEMARGNLDGAYSAYGEMLNISRGLSDPGRPESLRDVSLSLNNVGQVAAARGDIRKAKQHFDESLRVLTDLQRDGKLFPQWLDDIAWVKGQLARL